MLMGRLDLLHIINLRQLLFIKRLSSCNNNFIMVGLVAYYLNGRQSVDLQNKYGMQITWSDGKIKALMYLSFKNMFVPVPNVAP